MVQVANVVAANSVSGLRAIVDRSHTEDPEEATHPAAMAKAIAAAGEVGAARGSLTHASPISGLPHSHAAPISLTLTCHNPARRVHALRHATGTSSTLLTVPRVDGCVSCYR